MDNLNNTAEKKEKINLLWTGGWDSTYRLVELSRMDTEVQPIYIYGAGRRSEKYERAAMKKIHAMLSAHPETKAKLLPLIEVDAKTIPANAEITKAWETIHSVTKMGTQQEWVARYAHAKGIDLEYGVEATPTTDGHTGRSINNYTVLTEIGGISRFGIDKEKSTPEGVWIFGRLRFPILDKTEVQMKAQIKEWGYEDVMENIWFCHRPINGKPCGMCHPCEVKIETDMASLVGEDGIKRYKRWKKHGDKFWFKLYRKLAFKLSR